MSKKSKSQSKKSHPLNKMSKEAQALYKKLLELSKTTKRKPKLINNNDVYQFIEIKEDEKC
tara:strand:+ start:58 stop:240 length:183 start_codon:yes stop_codon:yes gene_type:complete